MSNPAPGNLPENETANLRCIGPRCELPTHGVCDVWIFYWPTLAVDVKLDQMRTRIGVALRPVWSSGDAVAVSSAYHTLWTDAVRALGGRIRAPDGIYG